MRRYICVKHIINAIAIIAMVLIILTPVNTVAAEGHYHMTVRQVLPISSAKTTYTYSLKPLQAGSPMPSGSTAKGYTFTIGGSEKADLDIENFTSEGIYRYELRDNHDELVYTIEVYVEASLDATIIAYNKDGTKSEEIVVTPPDVGYGPTDPLLMTNPTVKKTVTGSPDRPSDFSFQLAAQDEGNPMPAGSENGLKTIKITGSGEARFGTWSYEKAGNYHYTVREINDGKAGYSYDNAVYTISDLVKEENGWLTLSRVATNSAGKPVTTLAFVNKYNRSSSSGPGDGLSMPKTGDDSNAGFYMAMLAVGCAVALCSIAVIMKFPCPKSCPPPADGNPGKGLRNKR